MASDGFMETSNSEGQVLSQAGVPFPLESEGLPEELRWMELQAFMNNSLAEINEATNSVEKHMEDLHMAEGLRTDTESDSAASTADAPSSTEHSENPSNKKLEMEEEEAQLKTAMEALRNGDYSRLAVITAIMAESTPSTPDYQELAQRGGRRRQWSAVQRRDAPEKPSWSRPESAPAKRPVHASRGALNRPSSELLAWVPSFEERINNVDLSPPHKHPDVSLGQNMHSTYDMNSQADLSHMDSNGDSESWLKPRPPAGYRDAATQRQNRSTLAIENVEEEVDADMIAGVGIKARDTLTSPTPASDSPGSSRTTESPAAATPSPKQATAHVQPQALLIQEGRVGLEEDDHMRSKGVTHDAAHTHAWQEEGLRETLAQGRQQHSDEDSHEIKEQAAAFKDQQQQQLKLSYMDPEPEHTHSLGGQDEQESISISIAPASAHSSLQQLDHHQAPSISTLSEHSSGGNKNVNNDVTNDVNNDVEALALSKALTLPLSTGLHYDGQDAPSQAASIAHEAQIAESVGAAHSDHVSAVKADHVTAAHTDHVTAAHTDHVTAAHTDHVTAAHTDHVGVAHTDHVTAAHTDHVTAAHTDHVSVAHTDHVTVAHASSGPLGNAAPAITRQDSGSKFGFHSMLGESSPLSRSLKELVAADGTPSVARTAHEQRHTPSAQGNESLSHVAHAPPPPITRLPSVLRLELEARIQAIEASAEEKAKIARQEMHASVNEVELRVRKELGEEAARLRAELATVNARELAFMKQHEQQMQDAPRVMMHVGHVTDVHVKDDDKVDRLLQHGSGVFVLENGDHTDGSAQRNGDTDAKVVIIHYPTAKQQLMHVSDTSSTIVIGPNLGIVPTGDECDESLSSLKRLGVEVHGSGYVTPSGEKSSKDASQVLAREDIIMSLERNVLQGSAAYVPSLVHTVDANNPGVDADGVKVVTTDIIDSSVDLVRATSQGEQGEGHMDGADNTQSAAVHDEVHAVTEESVDKDDDKAESEAGSDSSEVEDEEQTRQRAEAEIAARTEVNLRLKGNESGTHSRDADGVIDHRNHARDTSFTRALTAIVRTDVIQERHERDFGDMGINMDEWERQEKLKRHRLKYTPRSLGVLTLTNPFRWRCIWMAEWRWFDRFILLTIAANCAFMASDDPIVSDPEDPRVQLLKSMGIVFQVIFTLEMVIKIVTLGFFIGHNTYLRDGWNCLDFFIVLSGMLEYLPSGGPGASSVILRTFRLLRPLRALRAVGRFKDLRMLVELLISCVPMLVNVFGLISFIFFVFGILGVQLWQGFFRGRCYDMTTGRIESDVGDNPCSDMGGFRECEPGYGCLKLYFNPNFDVNSFDTIGGAMIIIFQVMIQQAWSNIMYYTWDAYSFWTWPYFIFLNMVGPMFAIQLFLVVVANKYADAKLKQTEAENAAISLYEVKVGIVTANLPRGKANVSVDPYVKIQVDDKVKKTRILKNTSVPEWNEYFVFPVSSVASRCVITMYKWARTGPHEVLGQLTISVGTLDEVEEGTDKWYELVLPDGSAQDSLLHVRTQWRRGDTDEWAPLPEVADEDLPEEEDAEDEDKTLVTMVKSWFKRSAESKALNNATILVIIANMITMAADHDCYIGVDDYCLDFKAALQLSNIIFTCFFAVEMIVKIGGLGIVNYLKEMANVFDVIVVFMSLIEMPSVISQYICFKTAVNPPVDCSDSSQNGMTVLRSFRLVRVLRIGKLVRSFPQIQRQLKVITRTLGAVSSLVTLILLFILIFAILGMSLFGGAAIDSLGAEDADGLPYFRPDCFVRVLLPNDTHIVTWKLLTYNVSHFNGRGTGEDPFVFAPYKVHPWLKPENTTWIAYAADINPKDFHDVAHSINEPMIVGLRPRCCFDTFFFACLTVFQLLTTSDLGDVMYPALRGTSMFSALYFVGLVVIGNFMLFNLFVAIIITGFSETKAMIQKEERENQRMIEADKLRKAQSIARGQSLSQSPSLAASAADSRLEKLWKWFKKRVLKIQDVSPVTAEELKQKAQLAKQLSFVSDIDTMFTAKDTSHLRIWRRLAENRFFQMFIMLCIALSSAALAMQRPSASEIEETIIKYINLVCNYVFLFECCLKILSYGFLKYIKSRWNQLDFFLVVTSLVDLVIDTVGVGGGATSTIKLLRIFRIFRALRPLRIISRTKGLKMVLGTVARAIVPVMNTVAIALAVFFVFGIMAVQLIGANTSFCTDPFVVTKQECVGISPSGVPMEWRSRSMTYNWIGTAMLSMFVLASQDNWEMSMYAGMDATGRETSPVTDSNPGLALYFIAFMIVGSFFVIQLFVGVFIDTFQTVTSENKALSRQGSIASEKSSMTVSGLQEPMPAARLKLFELVTLTQFDITIAFFIVTNVLVMACEAYLQGYGQREFLSRSDFIFNYVFGAEVVAKLIGLYPRQYFQSRWNRFDFLVVMISFFGIAMDLQGASLSLNPTILRVLRIFRIFRILRAFRIFKAAEGLQKLVRTLIRSLNAVGNLGALLLLLFFIVGILTVELFGNLCADDFIRDLDPGKIHRCQLVDDLDLVDYHATFATLGMALLTLFRISTSDNWSLIMQSTQTEAGARPSKEAAISKARELINLYISTRNETFLRSARDELPMCQNEDELAALSDVVTCEYRQDGLCPSSCGSQFASSLIFSFFLCLSSFILLNLVMAVLMQELQEAMAMSSKTKSSLSVLMSVSAATNKWLKKVGETSSVTGVTVSMPADKDKEGGAATNGTAEAGGGGGGGEQAKAGGDGTSEKKETLKKTAS